MSDLESSPLEANEPASGAGYRGGGDRTRAASPLEVVAWTPDDNWTGSTQADRMRQILAKLEVTSNGPIGSYQPVGSKGAFQSREPTSGDSSPPHIRWAHAFNQCETDRERDRVIRDATAELETLTCRPVSVVEGETVEERDRRVLKEGKEFTAREVANTFRINVKDVWRIRQQAGLDKDLGAVRIVKDKTKSEAREAKRIRAKELRARYPGMTVRQIGLHVGVDYKTARSYLEDAA